MCLNKHNNNNNNNSFEKRKQYNPTRSQMKANDVMRKKSLNVKVNMKIHYLILLCVTGEKIKLIHSGHINTMMDTFLPTHTFCFYNY